MEKQENNQLKDLLKKYLDSTPMDSNQQSSASSVINMLDNSSTNVKQDKEAVKPSADDYLSAVELYEKLFGDDSGKKLTSHELSKELEEATNFLNHVIHMCEKAFNIDESELEDPKGNEDSDNKSSKENLDNEEDYDDSVSVFDLDIKESEYISNNLYDWGLEDAEVDIDKDGNVLVYGLLPDDVPHFTEAFNDAFSKDMSKQDITDYLKDAYNRYNSNMPLKDSYDEGCPIEDDPQNGRVFLKEMVVKIPYMDDAEVGYDLLSDANNGTFIDPKYYHYYVDGVKYIISKFPEEDHFTLLDKRFPLYDKTPLDGDNQLPYSISLDKMLVTDEKEDFELNKLKANNERLQYYFFTTDNKAFVIYTSDDSNAFYLKNAFDV